MPAPITRVGKFKAAQQHNNCNEFHRQFGFGFSFTQPEGFSVYVDNHEADFLALGLTDSDQKLDEFLKRDEEGMIDHDKELHAWLAQARAIKTLKLDQF